MTLHHILSVVDKKKPEGEKNKNKIHLNFLNLFLDTNVDHEVRRLESHHLVPLDSSHCDFSPLSPASNYHPTFHWLSTCSISRLTLNSKETKSLNHQEPSVLRVEKSQNVQTIPRQHRDKG